MALELVDALRNLPLAAPFATFLDTHLSALHQPAEKFETGALVHLIPASPIPQVTIPLPRSRTNPRVLSPPVVHTIPPDPVTPRRVESGPPPKILSPRRYNTRKRRKQASANFVSPITDKNILNPVNPQVEKYVINYETRGTQEY